MRVPFEPLTQKVRIHRYCSGCKLDYDKECTPESKEKNCCSRRGKNLLKAKACSQAATMPGYCKSGMCLTYLSLLYDGAFQFCPPSKSHICTAKCEGFLTTNVCYSRDQLPPSGTRVLLPNGAICFMSGSESECSHGPCSSPSIATGHQSDDNGVNNPGDRISDQKYENVFHKARSKSFTKLCRDVCYEDHVI